MYQAYYVHPKTGDILLVTTLIKPAKRSRTFRSATGRAKYRLEKLTSTNSKVVIVAKSTKKGKKESVSDEELEELEALEELEELLEDDEDDDDEVVDSDAEEDDDEDEDDLSELTVKELRAKARELGLDVKGLKKDGLIEAIEGADEESDDDDDEDEDEEEDEDVEDVEDDDEDSDDDEDEEPAPKKGKKGKKDKAKKAGRSKSTDDMVGTVEVAEAAGVTPRALRMVLRKNKVPKDEETQRYEWSSLKHPQVLKILKLVKAGASKEVSKERLENLRKGREKAAANRKAGKKGGKAKTGDTKKKRRKAA